MFKRKLFLKRKYVHNTLKNKKMEIAKQHVY